MSEPSVPWKTFLAIAAAAIGCSFEHGVIAIDDGGEDNTYECGCDCGYPPVSNTVAIAAASDDAEEFVASGIVLLNSSDLELTYEDGLIGSKQLVGLRFGALGIPQGSTILSAKIQFTVDEPTTSGLTLAIAAQAADDAPTFTAANFDLSSRPQTTASVPWSPPPWTTIDEAGPAQLTPELAPVLQELVNRSGWTATSAAAFLISGDGHRVARSFDFSPALGPRLIIQYQEPAIRVTLATCVPPELNPNLDGGVAPTADELADDCRGRVQTTLSGLAAQCGYPSVCTCALTPTPNRYASACDLPCDEVPLMTGCGNFDPESGNVGATNAPGDEPVCQAHSPIAAAIYGQRSRCEVTGTATIEVEDEDTNVTPASGVIELVGQPCPGQSCAVGMSYALELESVTYSHLFGSATFSHLASVGTSFAGNAAVLDAAGHGVFGPSALDIGARGSRGGDFSKVTGTNDNALAVSVAWAGPAPACEVSGAIVGNADPELKKCEPAGPNAICTSDADCADDSSCTDEVCNCLPVPEAELSMSLDVSGALVNRPPLANAGADQVVECNQAGRARFELRSQSSDLDGNLTLTRWYLGSRGGPVVSVGPTSTVTQAVGTSAAYVLRVIDAFAQADEDTTAVEVVDTTAPTIACNAPETIRPGQHGRSFTATAQDVCDPTVTPTVTGFTCSKNGRRHPCKVEFSGPTVTIINPSGVGTFISWDVTASDAAGNTTSTTCTVEVAVP
ncbi:MAG: hypothetical protein IRZ16_22280 [Myxococcaceae bacterium]|nr:hypothetical protein [Myxococcaceae bacterium]